MTQTQLNDLSRFNKFTAYTGDCIVWTGKATSAGYPCFWFSGKTVLAHRWIYQARGGAILPGQEIDHICKNPVCVNVNHLRVGTHRDNMKNAVHAQKQFCKYGHRFDERNTMYCQGKWGTARICKECKKRRWKNWSARRMAGGNIS